MLEGKKPRARAKVKSIDGVKAFLVFENLDQSTWPKTIRDSRGAYASLKGHLVHDLKNSDDLSATDPLADDLAVSERLSIRAISDLLLRH